MTPINLDAFASGQLGSKIWLCDKLEDQLDGPKTIRRLHILGGWYGVLPMLLVSRGRVSIEQVTCIDVDAEALRVARKMNDYLTGRRIRTHLLSWMCVRISLLSMLRQTSVLRMWLLTVPVSI